jgi:two-component system invasion response regulator UvrY
MTAPTALRVMCVDDNPLMTASIQRRIEREEGLEWAGASNGAGDLLGDISGAGADLLLLDVDMPGIDTFGLVERLAERCPSLRVAMLSGHLEPSYVARAIDAGAWGYLSKNDDVPALIGAVRAIGRGEIVFSEDVRPR